MVHNLVWLRAEFEPSGLLVNKHMPHRKAKAHAVNEEDPERDRATQLLALTRKQVHRSAQHDPV